VCGSGADQGFFFDLQPGWAIQIGQTSNMFDSKHALHYGGACPGDSEVSCVDDPDTSELMYTNSGTGGVAVYFVVDAHSSSGAGNFVLEWAFPGMLALPLFPIGSSADTLRPVQCY
jgi:hypothetical protein